MKICRKHTLELARAFRESAQFVANNPAPENIDPVLWKAQGEGYLSMAKDLEEQARAAE
jgi:hypothetical protein